jgi:hypothetical protein
MRVLVVLAMPGLMVASLAHATVLEACSHPEYASGPLTVPALDLPDCPAWPGWPVIMWLIASAALAALVFGIRSAQRPDHQATP